MDPALAIMEEAALSQQAMIAAMSRGESEVQRFYNNAAVFLTGGSGFIGKQLIEKLLRSCQISKVYVLLRTKKGKDIQERLDYMLKDPVFESLRQQKANFSEKIIPIEGDVAEIRLGIQDGDWRTLIEEVNVIFHVAATINFDETLRLATLINVRGTREAILLGKTCKNLRSHVHVSTAYCQATTTLIGKKVTEDFYTAPIPPEAMISMAEDMDPDRLRNITPDLIKDWPNTYTFTKFIGEELVRTTSEGLPMCIVRPAIVLSTSLEPVPGWLDTSCIYGASGIFLGIQLGVLHALHIKLNKKIALVPLDYVTNAMIVAAKETATNETATNETATNQAKGGNNTKIYTVSSVRRNPVTWSHLSKVLNNEGRTIPTPKAVYYCCVINTSNKIFYMILSLFLHIIPAYIADFICLLIGKQRRFVKLAKKSYRMAKITSFFMLNEWQYVDYNLEKLYDSLSEHDQAIYNFDITNLDWTKFALIWALGVRKYILKDELKDTVYALRKQRYLKIVHYFIMTLYVYSLWKLCCFIFYFFTR